MDQADKDKLEKELADVENELWTAADMHSTWTANVGPVRVTRVLTSMSWFRMILTVSGAAFLAGIPLTLVDKTQELGVALVVGAIFAGVSFLSQVWTVQTQREEANYDKLFGDEDRQKIRRLLDARKRLRKELGRDD
ncbi:hypothetical protein ACIA5D_36435 [Actinoplanes sp. NPDC051513]|uniref:hypothetical protein n=1 Tax=Actinoplanes sp. NPDC051513 TaxID=3363908 RepID=UPI0037A54BF5